MIFGFFVPQSFAFDVANCKQTKEKLDEEYINNTKRVDEEFTAKLQEIIMNRKEKDLPLLRCESCKDGSVCCEFSKKEREELEELKSLRNLFNTFYEQELKDINWACRNRE
jgi:hypothetical protein